MGSSRKRLFLIDGYSNIFRAFYAIRGLSSSKGQPTNAVWGFLQMLRKLLRDEQPDLVGVALDVSGDTVRKEQFEDYKANRRPMPEDLKAQMPYIRKVIEAHRIPILELEKYEADDVLGTLAKRAVEAGYDVVLVSADKDLMQLVSPHVSMFHTGRDKLYDPKLVEEDFGVPPERVIDVLALKGDAVDNVPGVPGIGEKGALSLVKEFGSLAELLERTAEIKRKSYREGLEEHRDKALLSLDLVTIHTDLPLEFSPEKLEHEAPDPEALADLARELEFFSLLEELQPAAAAETVDAAVALETASDWTGAASGLERPVFLGLVGPGAPLGLAAAGPEGEVVFADFRIDGMRDAVVETLSGWLDDPECELAGHDLKEVLRLSAGGPVCRARLFDTMLVSYLLRSALRSHQLAEVALDRLSHTALTAKDAGWGRGSEPMVGQESLLAYAAEQVELSRRMAPVMRKELEAAALDDLYLELEAPLLPVLLGMEETGIELDTGFLNKLSEEMGGELSRIEEEIYALAGDTFNINSPSQLGEVMFERLGYPVIKKTRKTKSYSTDQATLEELAIQGYELPGKVIEYRELSKLKSTYVDALPAVVGEDGRLHTRYHQAVATTGRLSSANPNLQNIPIRTEQGQRIRKAFVAPEGKLLLVADYSQVELRILAHIAQEEALVEAFLAGADIHRSTAATVFGVAEQLVTDEQRRAAKTINFGILYGMSAFGLAQNLKIERSEADKFIKTYLERFEGVRRYMDETLESAKSEGKVETLYGRIRWLPDINSKNFHLRENARRMAINARIQGTAADLQKKAMIGVDRFIRRDHPDAHLLLTVHDELVLEVPKAEVDEIADKVRAEMCGVEKLTVPLVVDVDSGKTWYDAKA